MRTTTKKKAFFALVAGVVFIVVTAVLAACTTSPPQITNNPNAESPGEVQRVTLEESKAAFENGEAIFLDVRSASSYAASHIPGALSIPLAELQSRIGELNPDQWIITYCT
jgi:3-mercaptopyruvate sulfurtransferase SseA